MKIIAYNLLHWPMKLGLSLPAFVVVYTLEYQLHVLIEHSYCVQWTTSIHNMIHKWRCNVGDNNEHSMIILMKLKCSYIRTWIIFI